MANLFRCGGGGGVKNLVVPKVIGYALSGTQAKVRFDVPDNVKHVSLQWTGSSDSTGAKYITGGSITISGSDSTGSTKVIASDTKTTNSTGPHSLQADVSQHTSVNVVLELTMSSGKATAILQNIQMDF